jgi:hypothetical protein
MSEIQASAPAKWERVSEFVSTELDDSIVILSLEAGRYYAFTVSGSVIWELLSEPQSSGSLVAALLGQFDVPRAQCEQSVETFLAKLEALDLVRLV